MRILIISYFCPPEVSAAAYRVFENATRFSKMGHDVTILTGLPNSPRGRLFPGYRYRLLQREHRDGVTIVRVASLYAPITSTFNRLRSYLSLMVAQMIGSFFAGSADVVIGSSPPLFTALAGYVASRVRRCPFVFEVADLWPENMVAIGSLKNKFVIWALRALELFLYRRANRIVPVTHGFKDYIAQKGIPSAKINVVTNGVDLDLFTPVEYPRAVARELGCEGKFVAAYIGTVGINHGIDVLLDAAELLRDTPDIAILIVGDGAERATLEESARCRRLTNVRFVGERPRNEMPAFHALADAMVVLLKKADYFRRVIPSKIFAAMGMQRPVLIAVEGESRHIIEEAGAGIGVEPDSAIAIADGIRRLRRIKTQGALREMGKKGREFVRRHFDRDATAGRYLDTLLTLDPGRRTRTGHAAPHTTRPGCD